MSKRARDRSPPELTQTPRVSQPEAVPTPEPTDEAESPREELSPPDRPPTHEPPKPECVIVERAAPRRKTAGPVARSTVRITRQEAANILGVSKEAVRNLDRRGLLRGLPDQFGIMRYSRADVTAVLKRRRVMQITRHEAALILRVSSEAIRNLDRRGILRGRPDQLGVVRYSRADVDAVVKHRAAKNMLALVQQDLRRLRDTVAALAEKVPGIAPRKGVPRHKSVAPNPRGRRSPRKQ